MGLDQYLTRKVYVGAEYEYRNVTGKVEIKVGKEKLNIDFHRISEISERVGYWRKANHIHSWFVENIQDGEDNCQEFYVPKESLEELKSLCEKIINSTKLIPGKIHNGTSYKGHEVIEHWEDGQVLADSTLAEEFLPTQSGFFFGSTNYDEYYWQDLLDTIEICNRALEAYDSHSGIYYQSSW